MPLFGRLFYRNLGPDYEKEFADALKRTRSWHLGRPDFNSTSIRYLNEDTTHEIGKRLKTMYKGRTPESLARKCFEVSLTMHKPIEDLLGVPLTLTLGYVKLHGRPHFHTATKTLKPMSRKNLATQVVRLHAWLTLPSHEIIDLTFFTTLGVDQQVPHFIGTTCLGHSDAFKDFLSFHPQLVGDGFLRHTNLLLDGVLVCASHTEGH